MVLSQEAAEMASTRSRSRETSSRAPSMQQQGRAGWECDSNIGYQEQSSRPVQERSDRERSDLRPMDVAERERNRWGDLIGQWRSCRM